MNVFDLAATFEECGRQIHSLSPLFNQHHTLF